MPHRTTRYFRRNYYIFALPLLVILASTIGYWLIERMRILDAFYMSCFTIVTDGYYPITSLSPAGRAFSVFVIFGGLTTVFFTASRVGQDMFIAATQRRKRRMEENVSKMKGHHILCGYGRMGRVIADELKSARAQFVIIENDADLAGELVEDGYVVIEGDATEDETLQRANVAGAKGLATVLATEADNLFVVLTARGMNPDLFILTRANNQSAVQKLYRAGATKVINPYDAAGTRIAQMMLRPVVTDFMELFSTDHGVSISMEEVLVQSGSRIAGKTLRDSDIRQNTNAMVIGIRKAKTGEMRYNPTGEEVVDAGDVLIAIAENNALNALADMARTPIAE